MRSKLFLILAAVVSVSACGSAPATPASPVEGAWRFSQLQRVSADGETTTIPVQESMILFSGGHYSIAFSSGDSRVPPYAEVWAPTEEEVLARMASIVVNSGAYEISGSTLTTHPIFALVPSYIGGRAEYEFSLSGDTLTLRVMNIVSADGVQLPLITQGSSDVYTLVRLN